MKYAVEMRSVAMIYVPNFIQIGSGIQELRGGIHTHNMVILQAHFSFFKIRKVGKSQECIYNLYYSQNKQQ
jgi:hypothetical protein